MALQSTDHLGHATDLGNLALFFQPTFANIKNEELVDALKELRPEYLTLCKYRPGQLSCLEYPTQIADDGDFFYRHDFRLRRTSKTRSRFQELDAMIKKDAFPPEKPAMSSSRSFIAESRIEELRALTSPDYDFQKLVRLCEELNSSYDNENYYATAMLTRAVLDHVPPLFGQSSFSQVANNYSGGKSFKETMQHLEGAARKISDGHLHAQIRKSETLPTAQQVNCASQLDVLLAEIVRITK